MPPLTDTLKAEYISLFNNCTIRPERAGAVTLAASRIKSNKNRYEYVGNPLNIPWYFIGLIHNMEGSLRFDTHLHNGDPLTARTKNYPPWRPLAGNPPFTWEESASDSLRKENLHLWNDWSLGGVLYKLEAYNGFGYRNQHPNVKSPYLWSFTNQYTMGKYYGDRKWSDTVVSQQCGAAAILKSLVNTNDVVLGSVIIPVVTNTSSTAKIKFSNLVTPHAKELQEFLNKVNNTTHNPDGKPGRNTSDGMKKAFGFYLEGDSKK